MFVDYCQDCAKYMSVRDSVVSWSKLSVLRKRKMTDVPCWSQQIPPWLGILSERQQVQVCVCVCVCVCGLMWMRFSVFKSQSHIKKSWQNWTPTCPLNASQTFLFIYSFIFTDGCTECITGSLCFDSIDSQSLSPSLSLLRLQKCASSTHAPTAQRTLFTVDIPLSYV